PAEAPPGRRRRDPVHVRRRRSRRGGTRARGRRLHRQDREPAEARLDDPGGRVVARVPRLPARARRRRGVRRRHPRPQRPRARDRAGGRARPDEQGDRRRALRERADRQVPPAERVPQARDRQQDRGRAVGDHAGHCAGFAPVSARSAAAAPPSAPAAELVDGLPAWPELDAAELAHVLDRAEALSAGLGDDAARRVAAGVIAAAAGARLALAGRLTAERADELVAWAAREGALEPDETRTMLFPRVLLDVLASGPEAARTLEALLRTLVAFGPASGADVLGPGGRAGTAVGETVGERPLEVPIPDCEAVLRVAVGAGDVARCEAFAEETARVLRAAVRAPSTVPAADGAKLEAAHRRLRRLALDLHDGPAQDVAALTADVALLEADLADEPSPERLLEAQ